VTGRGSENEDYLNVPVYRKISRCLSVLAPRNYLIIPLKNVKIRFLERQKDKRCSRGVI